jgi:RNA polymerase sigma factor (sigma-70 family)
MNIDEEGLLQKILDNDQNLDVLYRRYKEPTIRFLNSYTSSSSSVDFGEVYQDTVIAFYENLKKGKINGTSSISTYLNSIAKNIINNRNRNSNVVLSTYKDSTLDFDPDITLSLEEIEIDDKTYDALNLALIELHQSGGNCHKLIMDFWYRRMSIGELTKEYGYINDDTTKQQKAKCQKRLKILSHKHFHTS